MNMKAETKRKIQAGIVWTVMGAMSLAFAASCDNGSTTPPDHAGTINAFGKNIAVSGDPSISISDFNNIVTKLNSAMQNIDAAVTSAPSQRDKYINMLNRSNFVIIIGTGNAGPAANANKQMTIGFDYLSTNNSLTIEPVPKSRNQRIKC